MSKIQVTLSYEATFIRDLNIPEDWKDVKDWYIKWDVLHYTTEDPNSEHTTWKEIDLDSDIMEVDRKRTSECDVLVMDDEEESDNG